MKFSVALQGFWMLRGYATEGRNVIRAALALPTVQASDLAQSHALYVGASLAGSQSDHAEAQQMLETCLELRRGLGIPFDIASTLSTLSLARLQAGDPIGAATGEDEALLLFRQLGHRIGESIGLLHLGQIAVFSGDDVRAREYLELALSIARDIKHQEVEGECELVLGETAFEAEDLPRALVRFTRSLAVCRDAGDKRGEANALWWLGKLDLLRNDLAQARNRLNGALRSFRDFEMRDELLSCFEDHAALAANTGSIELAIKLAASASALRTRLGLARVPRGEKRWLAFVERLQQAAVAESFAAGWAEGECWELENAMSSALAAQ